MPQPRYLMAALLLLVLTFAPLTGWPNGEISAYAESVRADGASRLRARSWGPLGAYIVATSNENERQDREDRRGREENDNRDDDNDDGSPPPPPPQRIAPPPPPNQVGSCLGNGGSVTLTLDGGSATAKVFQDNLNVELTKVDPGSMSPPPGALIGDLIFRVSAGPCGGGSVVTLPSEANLGVSYRERVEGGRDETKFSLQYWDGQKWSAAPKQATDPGNNYVSATISATGIYALAQP